MRGVVKPSGVAQAMFPRRAVLGSALVAAFVTSQELVLDVDVRRGTSTYVDVRRLTSTYVDVGRRGCYVLHDLRAHCSRVYLH